LELSKTSHIKNPSQCEGFRNIKADRHKKSQKELAKTRLLKLSKTSRILTALNRHITESQMVPIVTVTQCGTRERSFNQKGHLTEKIN
jgi:hypothetical protein